MPPKKMYRVIFSSQGKMYEIFARKVSQADMYGFIEIEELVFGERTSLVVDPSEEALKSEFSGVKRTYIPYHTVSRIDEVEKEGPGKILQFASSSEGPIQMPVPPGKK